MIKKRLANIASSVIMSKTAIASHRPAFPAHCFPIKIHGESRLQVRAVRRIDIRPRTAVAPRTILVMRSWLELAVSLMRRKKTEHFVVHSVTM